MRQTTTPAVVSDAGSSIVIIAIQCSTSQLSKWTLFKRTRIGHTRHEGLLQSRTPETSRRQIAIELLHKLRVFLLSLQESPLNSIDSIHPLFTCPLAPNGDHAATLLKISHYVDRERARQEVETITQVLLKQTGRGWRLDDADLSGANFEGFNLSYSTLNRAQLYGTNFSRCDLSYVTAICPGAERVNFSAARLTGANLHAIAAQCCNFDDADLEALVDTTGALFHGCSMRRVRAPHAMLAGTSFYQCNIEDGSFAGATLRSCTFSESSLAAVDFSDANVAQLTFNQCQLERARFDRASGSGVAIRRPTSCHGLSLHAAHLSDLNIDAALGRDVDASFLSAPYANFVGCSLPGARFESADLAGARFHQCDFSGVKLSYANCENAVATVSSFVAGDLRQLRARGFVARNCDFGSADLSESYLYRATFTGDPSAALCLHGARLRGSVLTNADICANLRSADLSHCHASYARFFQCDLRGAQLVNAQTHKAFFVKCDMEDARLGDDFSTTATVDRCTGLPEDKRQVAPSDHFEVNRKDIVCAR